MIDKYEVVMNTLAKYPCSSSKQLSCAIKRENNLDISPAAVGGTLRSAVAKGKVGKSNCGNGNIVYWINKEN